MLAIAVWDLASKLAPTKQFVHRQKCLSKCHSRLGGFREREPGAHQAMFEDLFRWQAEGKLHPQISVTAPLAQSARVLAAVAQREVLGKPVLTVG